MEYISFIQNGKSKMADVPSSFFFMIEVVIITSLPLLKTISVLASFLFLIRLLAISVFFAYG